MEETDRPATEVTAPPATKSVETDWDALVPSLTLAMVPGVGPLLQRDLLKRFGTASKVLAAAPSELREIPRLGAKLCYAITQAGRGDEAQAEIERCRQNGIRVLSLQDQAYPSHLAQIEDPPSVLYTQGTFTPQDTLAIAVVGTRHASHYGRKQAQKLAGGLARAGVTVVSGLARGIDTVAHQAAIEVGGRTIAVLGSGLLDIYPADNKKLALEVIQHGVLMSEFATQAKPARGSFPRRNRVVTGLSQGVVVIEAGDRSGALISARHAMEQGREVFAVPGPVDSRVSRGCHRLIRDGAKLVESVDDILEELGPMFQPSQDAEGHEVHRPAELQLNEIERSVLRAIGNQPTTIDEVMQTTGLPIHRLLSTISVLEMRRLVRRLSGTQVVRA